MVTKITRFVLTDSAIEGYGNCNGKEIKILNMPYTYREIPTLLEADLTQIDTKLCTLKISHEFLEDLVQLFNHSLNVQNRDI